MWLPKPVYEALPYYYLALGVLALVVQLYVDYWYWPVICTIVGVGSVVAGAVVWVKRRGHRARTG
jgi:hypothetical protein